MKSSVSREVEEGIKEAEAVILPLTKKSTFNIFLIN